LFADDTAIYIVLTSANQSVTLQNDINQLKKWELEWDEFTPSSVKLSTSQKETSYTNTIQAVKWSHTRKSVKK
jgi:hypothetical protein